MERAIARHKERVAKARQAQLDLVAKEAKKEQVKRVEEGRKRSLIVILKLKASPNALNTPIKASSNKEVVVGGKVAKITNSRGRTIQLPTRFQNNNK